MELVTVRQHRRARALRHSRARRRRRLGAHLDTAQRRPDHISNGGLIAGRNAVLAIEGFNNPQGAVWLAARRASSPAAGQHTSRSRTITPITRMASPATSAAGAPRAPRHRAHARSRRRAQSAGGPVARRGAERCDSYRSPTSQRHSISADAPFASSRGAATPRATSPSSSTIRASCSAATCSGTRCSPTSSTPSRRSSAQSVRALRRSRDTIYVPGHGALGKRRSTIGIRRCSTRWSGRRGRRTRRTSAADAGAAFSLPQSLGDWTLFSKDVLRARVQCVVPRPRRQAGVTPRRRRRTAIA